MKSSKLSEATDAYRDEIRRCAQALALANHGPVAGRLAPRSTLPQVKLFTDGNLDKRFEKLSDQLELLADEFDDFEELIVEYVRTVPLAAYDTGSSDAERLLDWLCGRCELSDEQLDLVTCQRSRHAVEVLAADNRLAHLRFQELTESSAQFSGEVTDNPDLWLHLNPIHVTACFRTRVLLDEEDEVPAHVVFFPVGNDIRTAVLEDEGRRLVEVLEANGPLRMSAVLDALWESGRDETVDLCRELAELGLAAMG